MCTSYARHVQGTLQTQVWTDVLPGNQVVGSRTVYTGLDGSWQATTTTEHDYDDEGRLLELRTAHRHRMPELDTDAVEARRYDDGRWVASLHRTDGVVWKEERRSYDADGHLVRLETDYANGWADEWEETTWADGRRQRSVTWRDGTDTPLYEMVWSYLQAPPRKDAVIETFFGTSTEPHQRWTERYQGGQRVEAVYEATESQPAQAIRYGYDDDGRRVWRWHERDGGTTLDTDAYDAAGRRLRTRTGPDDDEDLVHDRVEDEQLWVWTCR